MKKNSAKILLDVLNNKNLLGDKKKKQNADNDPNRSNIRLTETSFLDKKKNFDMKSNASAIGHGRSSVISENINESFDMSKMYLKLDKIVEKNCGGVKELKETIENQDFEKKLLLLIEDTEKMININQISSPNEEGGKYEYVEKALLDRLKKEGDDLKKKTNAVVDQLTDLNKAFRKIEGEHNFLKQLYSSQKKLKEENEIKIKGLNENLKYFDVVNEELKSDLTNYKLDKENIYRTLLSFIGKIDERFSDEMKELIASYNNQYFLTKFKAKDEGKVEIFLGQISTLDKKMSQINFEISCLKKMLVEDKVKHSGNK